MSCNRSEQIKGFIHFNDNTIFEPARQDRHDNLHKTRTFLDVIRQRLLLAPKEYLALDEQIIPTKSRSYIKQHNAQKSGVTKCSY
jgi:hypothetical protein